MPIVMANLPDIGEQLRAAESNRARRRGRAGCELEQGRLALLPVDRPPVHQALDRPLPPW